MIHQRNISYKNAIDAIQIDGPDLCEYHLNAVPDERYTLNHIIRETAEICHAQNAQVIKMDIFGSENAFHTASQSIKEAFETIHWPVSFIMSEQWSGARLGGIYTLAVSGAEVQTVTLEDHPVGRTFEDRAARYTFIGDVHPTLDSTSPKEETRQIFNKMEKALHLSGMDVTHIVRTWFYNHHILDWYDTFNDTRSAFYSQKDIFNGLLPASTGMGGSNIHQKSILGGTLAVKPKSGDISIQNIASPLQGPACEYGSSFSRAVEITTPRHRRVLVSGTASIDAAGNTIHVNDICGQIDHTMHVIEAILHSRNMTSAHVTRVYAYFKYSKDIPHSERIWKRWEIPPSRIIHHPNDICREDLLFEMEVDALTFLDNHKGLRKNTEEKSDVKIL